MENKTTEFWLRGPLPNMPALLQPAAHALLQSNAEISDLMKYFPNNLLWETPAGNASPAFHLQHITGVLDRLFTYANNNPLTSEQLKYLSEEGKRKEFITSTFLVKVLDIKVKESIDFLHQVDSTTLTEVRLVGRDKLPSTQIGLLFHAAEHTMRHTGQLLVTVRVLLQDNKPMLHSKHQL